MAKIPRVMLCAAKSGSGKTTITCALLNLLKSRGTKVRAYKCGPDYIDPMFHKRVLGIESKNLDLFFTDEDTTRDLFLEDNCSDISVIEGVMGLYDGLGGISAEASSYHLASALSCPVILVVDAHGMGRSLIALIKGFLSMDENQFIKGIILNRISKGFYETVKPVIESETNIKCVGFVPDVKDMSIDSRHLGLLLPDEVLNLNEKIEKLSIEVLQSVDVDEIIDLAGRAPELEYTDRIAGNITEYSASNISEQPVRIAIASDEAFCFYYEDNLKLLKKMGAELVPFSPVHDEKLPDDISGILLGGGYPECYAKKLSNNESMLSQIRMAVAKRIPIFAECGGFMYLHRHLILEDGQCVKMAGVIDADCSYTGHLVRFGYIELGQNKEDDSRLFRKARGHEFHYFDSTDNGDAYTATKPTGKRSWNCIHDDGVNFWGFPHLYYPSNPQIAQNIVERCRKGNS